VVGGVNADYTFHWFDGNVSTPVIGSANYTGSVYANRDALFYTVVAVNNTTGCSSLRKSIEVADGRQYPDVSADAEDQTACDPSKANGIITSDVVVGNAADYTFNVFYGQNTTTSYCQPLP
jgi:hypothetical protein